MLLAAVVRYVYLWDVPRFRDETFSALLSLSIFRGERLPLTDIEYYIGPLYPYLVAGVMFGFGPSIYVPRLVTMVFGVLTVGAAFLMGREVGGRLVGVVAAGLLLMNGVHVASISHRGFSAELAVCFSTVGFWLLYRARARRSGPALAGSGLFLGLALHTHATTVAFFPGVLAWLLPDWRAWVRARWPYVALGLFLLAYLPMLAFNVQTGGGSLRHAMYTAGERPDYTLGQSTDLTVGSYIERQRDFWRMSAALLSGVVTEEGRASWRSLPTLAAATWAVIGLAYAARQGYTFPLWLLGSCAIVLPVFNARHWDVLGDAHYAAKMLPAIYAAMGLVAVAAGRRAWQWRHPAGRIVTIGLVLGTAAMALASGTSLVRYYADTVKAQPSNASLIRAIADLEARREATELVILDDHLNDQRVQNAAPWDEASTFRVFRFIMAFDDVPCKTVAVDDDVLSMLAARGAPTIVILSPGANARATAELTRRIERFGLQALDGQAARAARPADRYAMYRLVPPVPAPEDDARGDATITGMRDCSAVPVLPSANL